MKERLKIVSTLLILFQSVLAFSQSDSIKIENIDIQKADSVITIMADFDISEVIASKDRTIKILPVLKSDENIIELAPIIINGRNKHILYNRSPKSSDYGEYLRKNGTEQIIGYTQTIKFSPWMRRSQLNVIIDKCGCGRDKKELDELAVLPIRLNPEPFVSYLTPDAENVKMRNEQGTAYLDFPVNQVKIYPDFRNNIRELAKIFNSVEKVIGDSNVQITSIDIHGFASPEGGYKLNTSLADRRSVSLKSFLANYLGIPGTLVNVKYTPEDWQGLKQFVINSDIPEKESVINFIDSNVDLNTKEQQLRKLVSQNTYHILTQNCYPALRRANYKINYVVRGFNVDEAKIILRQNPGQLSLQEIYQIAYTLNEGDEEFEELFDIAVRLFPDDQIANLNASSLAIRKKDIKAAEKYLNKCDETKPETLNNLGALYLLKGDVDKALEYFSQASDSGLAEASYNLRDNVK